jgi:quercetin dioxygenase-like cupin family protein
MPAQIAATDTLFHGLVPCDVRGLRERAVARGHHTVAYVGEFTPVPSISWTAGPVTIYLYVLSGSGIVRTDGSVRHVRTGDFVVIAKGARHAVNATSTAMRALYVEDRS